MRHHIGERRYIPSTTLYANYVRDISTFSENSAREMINPVETHFWACDVAPSILNRCVLLIQERRENISDILVRFFSSLREFTTLSKYLRTMPLLEPSPLHRTWRRSIRESLNPEFAEPGNLRAGNSSHLDGERDPRRKRGWENICHSPSTVNA